MSPRPPSPHLAPPLQVEPEQTPRASLCGYGVAVRLGNKGSQSAAMLEPHLSPHLSPRASPRKSPRAPHALPAPAALPSPHASPRASPRLAAMKKSPAHPLNLAKSPHLKLPPLPLQLGSVAESPARPVGIEQIQALRADKVRRRALGRQSRSAPVCSDDGGHPPSFRCASASSASGARARALAACARSDRSRSPRHCLRGARAPHGARWRAQCSRSRARRPTASATRSKGPRLTSSGRW